MEVPNSVLKYGFIALLVLMIVGAVFAAITKHNYDSELARLRNEVASRDVTIEVQQGVFTKLSMETEDLRSLLKSQDQEIKDLLTQIKKNKEEILAANSLVIKWKKAYDAKGTGTQTETPGEGGVVRKKVEFAQNWGMYGVKGFTLTDPAEFSLKLEQLKDLEITLAITQDASGAWHSYATSNDENTTMNIKLAAVNPHLLEPKWYEKIQINAHLAGGQGGAGFGVLAGVGVAYKVKQFDIGPTFFLAISDRVDKYFGASITWRPFEK